MSITIIHLLRAVLVFGIMHMQTDGMSPSGKATGFGPVIRGFESLHPNQKFLPPQLRGYFMVDSIQVRSSTALPMFIMPLPTG